MQRRRREDGGRGGEKGGKERRRETHALELRGRLHELEVHRLLRVPRENLDRAVEIDVVCDTDRPCQSSRAGWRDGRVTNQSGRDAAGLAERAWRPVIRVKSRQYTTSRQSCERDRNARGMHRGPQNARPRTASRGRTAPSKSPWTVRTPRNCRRHVNVSGRPCFRVLQGAHVRDIAHVVELGDMRHHDRQVGERYQVDERMAGDRRRGQPLLLTSASRGWLTCATLS